MATTPWETWDATAVYPIMGISGEGKLTHSEVGNPPYMGHNILSYSDPRDGDVRVDQQATARRYTWREGTATPIVYHDDQSARAGIFGCERKYWPEDGELDPTTQARWVALSTPWPRDVVEAGGGWDVVTAVEYQASDGVHSIAAINGDMDWGNEAFWDWYYNVSGYDPAQTVTSMQYETGRLEWSHSAKGDPMPTWPSVQVSLYDGYTGGFGYSLGSTGTFTLVNHPVHPVGSPLMTLTTEYGVMTNLTFGPYPFTGRFGPVIAVTLEAIQEMTGTVDLFSSFVAESYARLTGYVRFTATSMPVRCVLNTGPEPDLSGNRRDSLTRLLVARW